MFTTHNCVSAAYTYIPSAGDALDTASDRNRRAMPTLVIQSRLHIHIALRLDSPVMPSPASSLGSRRLRTHRCSARLSVTHETLYSKIALGFLKLYRHDMPIHRLLAVVVTRDKPVSTPISSPSSVTGARSPLKAMVEDTTC